VRRGKRISLGDGNAPMGWGKLLDSEERKWMVD
jgi:hypothetical protein